MLGDIDLSSSLRPEVRLGEGLATLAGEYLSSQVIGFFVQKVGLL